ncbi:HAD hydrolase family protein [Streptomyces sp. NPDC051639]|uniref:HAD family hydrolase n=1 Tax=Streptomyces sp. NPDC051639 TaxID=3155671 RepID=UPI003434D06B
MRTWTTSTSRVDHTPLPNTKVLCRSSHLNAGDLAQRAEELGFDVTVTYSCRPQEGGPVEVLSPLASKGHAVRRILTEAGIDLTETVAFGDRTNDIPMLDIVGDGIVIGHPAEPRLSRFASAPSVGAWLQAHRDRWPVPGRHTTSRPRTEAKQALTPKSPNTTTADNNPRRNSNNRQATPRKE